MTQRKQRLVAWMFSFSTECSPVKTAALINIAGESHGDHFHQTAKDSANPRAHAPSAQLLGLPARLTCSSDLQEFFRKSHRETRWLPPTSASQASGRSRSAAQYCDRRRSEERRVGKECRSRWSPYHYKKK